MGQKAQRPGEDRWDVPCSQNLPPTQGSPPSAGWASGHSPCPTSSPELSASWCGLPATLRSALTNRVPASHKWLEEGSGSTPHQHGRLPPTQTWLQRGQAHLRAFALPLPITKHLPRPFSSPPLFNLPLWDECHRPGELV